MDFTLSGSPSPRPLLTHHAHHLLTCSVLCSCGNHRPDAASVRRRCVLFDRPATLFGRLWLTHLRSCRCNAFSAALLCEGVMRLLPLCRGLSAVMYLLLCLCHTRHGQISCAVSVHLYSTCPALTPVRTLSMLTFSSRVCGLSMSAVRICTIQDILFRLFLSPMLELIRLLTD